MSSKLINSVEVRIIYEDPQNVLLKFLLILQECKLKLQNLYKTICRVGTVHLQLYHMTLLMVYELDSFQFE